MYTYNIYVYTTLCQRIHMYLQAMFMNARTRSHTHKALITLSDLQTQLYHRERAHNTYFAIMCTVHARQRQQHDNMKHYVALTHICTRSIKECKGDRTLCYIHIILYIIFTSHIEEHVRIYSARLHSNPTAVRRLLHFTI